MKRLALVGWVLCWSSVASAAELSYKWKAGATHRFSAESHDVVGMSGMGINQAMTTDLRSTFTLKITKVKPNGTAQATLNIESFEVKDDQGNKLAGLEGIPAGAVKSLVEIDKKGNFTFLEEVFLVVDEESGQNMLVSAKGSAGKNGVSGSASAQNGEEKVTLTASFDPKTGKLSAGYTVEKLKKPSKKVVTITQEKPKVDLLPTQFLELLKLPEGELAAGTTTPMKLSHPNIDSNTTVSVRIDELTAARARFNTKIASANKTSVPTSEPKKDPTAGGADDMGGGDMGMGGMGGMPGMGGMGMPGMGGGGMPGATGGSSPDVKMGMKVDADFDMDFDIAKGILSTLSGTMKTDTSMGGMMSVKSDSKLLLKRL